MSNQSGDGISDVKAKACDILIDHRLTLKAKDPKKAEAIMSKMFVAQTKKRDNVVRDSFVPDTFLKGLKKQGPTIKELQEEYGGAGMFYIPEEEHYLLEKEEWRYDKWPEFYLGKNVADFYDKDIEEKLDRLEAEEAKILKLEEEAEAAKESSEDEDDITMADLKTCVKDVRGKINIIKQRHVLKAKRRAKSKIKDYAEMTADLKAKGINVNEDSLANRVKNRRSLSQLESHLDEKAAKALEGVDSDSDDDESIEDVDEATRKQEGERRGRKKTRDGDVDMDDDGQVKLGKRRRAHDAAVDLDGDESVPKAVRSSLSKRNMRMTPEQRRISVKKL